MSMYQLKRSPLDPIYRAFKGAFGEVWAQNMGKAGLILLVFLVAISIYTTIVMPSNFDSVWNNRKEWDTNPFVAPPEWIRFFGFPVARHAIIELDRPVESKVYLEPFFIDDIQLFGYIQRFSATYVLDSDAYPQSILVRFAEVGYGTITIRGRMVEPQIVVYVFLNRPDGSQILINAPETLTLKSLAGKDIRLDQDTAAAWIERKLNVPQDVAKKVINFYLFGEVVGENFYTRPLQGAYSIDIVISYLAPGVDPRDLKTIMESKGLGAREITIIVKGSAYGLAGTDDAGRDLFLGLLYGFPVALLIGIFAAVSAVLIGMIAGVISGYYGGVVDDAIQRTVDIIGNIPLLPILILIGVIVQEWNVSAWERLFIIIAFLVVFSWGGLAIIIRSMTLSIKAEPYIEAARALGASNVRIIFRHIIPQLVPYMMASLVFSVPGAILAEAGLSVIGVRHGLPTWGSILAEARAYIGAGGSYGVWWWIFPPGILIGITALTFVLLGLAAETIVEPRLRRRM